MSDAQQPGERHSSLWLNDTRDEWWNRDFLALLRARGDLAACRRALDVGSGHGHWTRAVARLLERGAHITGIEREPAWVERARAAPLVDGVAVDYLEGRAEELPFADVTFDLVTCQTVLMHVADAALVAREMLRVLRPGGRLLLCEPNLFASASARMAALPELDPEDAAAFVRLQLFAERGRRLLGEGDSSIGERLVGLLPHGSVQEVQCFINDRTVLFRAPYSAHCRAEHALDRSHFDAEVLTWPRVDTERYFLAGGGARAELDGLWRRACRAWSRRLELIDEGSYAANEGGLFYVLIARK